MYEGIIALALVLTLSLVFYQLKLRAFVFVSCMFGFVFSIYALSYSDIPFFPFFQLFMAIIFLMILIKGHKLGR